MRQLFIALVLLFTVLTFYSALWFKSTVIENDITQRVTDGLSATNAKDVAVDVDGRHVTLSGVVYDEATEAAHLKTADRTYGALGPIDGLTYLADGGFVTAIKDDAGITLRGTVPNDDVRATLVANAEGATDGAVDDQLVVSGPTAAWQDEAVFGVSQLAGLDSGTLTASTDTYSLSGSTDGDPADVTAGLADRDGWQSFVSSPMAERSLSDDMMRLNAEIDDRDAQIVELTSDRDSIGVELDTLRASLSDGESNSANLRAELTASQSDLADATAKIDENTVVIEDLTAQVDGLEVELANRQNTLGATGEQVASLRAELDAANGSVVDLTAQVEGRDQSIANFTGLVAERDDTIERLSTQVGGRDQSIATFTRILTDRDDTIARLSGQVDGRDGSIANFTGLVAERDDTIARLSTQVDARDETIANFTGLVAERDDTIAGLTGQVADRDQTIVDLQQAASDSESDQVAALNAQIAQRDDTIDTLNATLADTTGTVGNLEGDLAQTASQIALLTRATEAGDAEVESLSANVTDLTAVVAERDATIASMQTPVVTVEGMDAEQCAQRANAALEGAQINFDTNTATIQNASVPLLERLTGIALACVNEGGLAVEVGGHTDSRGSDENNQALSEARAQAIVTFMAARGVPSTGLTAVGYGETQPIGDNSTDAGRTENRRISFEWQAQ